MMKTRDKLRERLMQLAAEFGHTPGTETEEESKAIEALTDLMMSVRWDTIEECAKTADGWTTYYRDRRDAHLTDRETALAQSAHDKATAADHVAERIRHCARLP